MQKDILRKILLRTERFFKVRFDQIILLAQGDLADRSVDVYHKTLSDGRQVWVEVRNGAEITNGGINLVPRP